MNIQAIENVNQNRKCNDPLNPSGQPSPEHPPLSPVTDDHLERLALLQSKELRAALAAREDVLNPSPGASATEEITPSSRGSATGNGEQQCGDTPNGNGRREIQVASVWPERGHISDEHLREIGDPFICNREGSLVIDWDPHYWTARYAHETLVTYYPGEGKFYSYDKATGLWSAESKAQLRLELAKYLRKYSQALEQRVLSDKRSPYRLNEVLNDLEAHALAPEGFSRPPMGVLHVKNGMLDLNSSPPTLRDFAHTFYSTYQIPFTYDDTARCPDFLDKLVRPAMSDEDVKMLQLFCGQFLLGRNIFQNFLVFSGPGGSGKGTIERIIRAVIGQRNIKPLRTSLLGERFELDDLGKASLLIGADVDDRFLFERGANVIKALVGGDELASEKKGGAKSVVVGEVNILILTNSDLQLRVKGDNEASAWERRMHIIEFTRRAAKQIRDFDRVLLLQEGSGILNWMIDGAMEILSMSEFPVTDEQKERVTRILRASDSLRIFVDTRVRPQDDARITVEELLDAYESFCDEQRWEAKPRRQVQKALGPLMAEIHKANRRNDIVRDGGAKRGFKHVRLTTPADHVNGACCSDVEDQESDK
ncbi:DNA primase family protein [Roseimicrobium sp. ORNL1]|uniref:DNA primase family protein n=1 Tax=Roseimicrobium sp. ORNL1 TaxID=2711231 RepID=UPI0013E1EFF9|nr:DNA primase family protein [Roseimicrobium sp. ORNL1]QIF02896.1 hypothetical protein G5S37_15675 [Roseimicrobium sp. ORNL1]